MYRIKRWLHNLAELEWREIVHLSDWEMRKAVYKKPGEYEYETPGYELSQLDPLHSMHGVTYFLRKQIHIPVEWKEDETGFVMQGGGEGLLSIDGVPYHGIDRNHDYVPLRLGGGSRHPVLEIELYDPIPEPADPLNGQATIHPPIAGIRTLLVRVNKPLQSLLYTARTAVESALLLPEQDMRRLRMFELLYALMDDTERRLLAGQDSDCSSDSSRCGSEEGARPARLGMDARWAEDWERRVAALAASFQTPGGSQGFMHMVGQSHIDVAWLWPVRETVRKVSRTFSTIITLMKEYPDFCYTQSQPLLYAFVKEHYPELFEQIRQRVAEGRWELAGGMWVEPDLNIPSGESLVRQMLYGQLFYKEEFGRTSAMEWLPDTFGYCASLPQLLKLAGVDYFMTTKLNWNDTNVFPYDLFQWVGIDGTSVLAYLNHGLNEHTHPKDVSEHWQSFRQKDKVAEQMLLYGHGDGGGGVTREMVEYVKRSQAATGLPESRFSTASAFFERVSNKADALPKWHGDLYLELHRGTYTTHARNKRSNRLAEALYRDAELWSCHAADKLGKERTEALQRKLREGWKLIMLNQFHDIIPGTAIPEVYETSAAEYDTILRIGQDVLLQSLSAIAGEQQANVRGGDGSLPEGISGRHDKGEEAEGRTDNAETAGQGGWERQYGVFNSLGWARSEVVSLPVPAELSDYSAYDGDGEPLKCELLPLGREDTDAKQWRFLSVSVRSVPAFGYTAVKIASAGRANVRQEELHAWKLLAGSGSGPAEGMPHEPWDGRTWETEHELLTFNENGEMIGWYDKEAGRELLPEGAKANEWQLFHDKPLQWDAWDVDARFAAQRAGAARLVGAEVALDGGTQQILRFEWRLNRSTIRQDIVFFPQKRRVEFRTRVDWREEHKLLKVAFPADMVASKATYEIPFGALERPTHENTSWEQAQYEVCGHRFADLSEGGYGISLLNDCKYGYDIKGSTLRLTLLRSPRWPDMTADIGEHEFTYAIYPHEGDWRAAHVVRQAAELNQPLRIVDEASSIGGTYLELHSKHVVLETVKAAERGEGTIIRLYESSGGRETIVLKLPAGMRKASVVNLLEEELNVLAVDKGELRLSFKPFEVITLRVWA